MIVLKIIEIILVVFYGSLNLYTGYICFKGNETTYWSNIMMILGGTTLILSILLRSIIKVDTLAYLILGFFLIQGAAINYDLKMFKEMDRRHQALRIIISIIIVLLYYKSF